MQDVANSQGNSIENTKSTLSDARSISSQIKSSLDQLLDHINLDALEELKDENEDGSTCEFTPEDFEEHYIGRRLQVTKPESNLKLQSTNDSRLLLDRKKKLQ